MSQKLNPLFRLLSAAQFYAIISPACLSNFFLGTARFGGSRAASKCDDVCAASDLAGDFTSGKSNFPLFFISLRCVYRHSFCMHETLILCCFFFIRAQNMVGPGEVDPELQDETASECARFGKVDSCLVYEVRAAPGGMPVAEDEAVRIFVRFSDPKSAGRAIQELHGRFFGGRQVRATFFDEGRFSRLELQPTPGE
jgi:hypothetical protein